MLLIALGFRNTDGAPAPEFTTNVEALIVRRRTAFKHACFTDGAGAGLPAAPHDAVRVRGTDGRAGAAARGARRGIPASS